MKKKVIFEMETSDPDDFMTLLWLADHPEVNLLAVLVTPGGRDQCQLVQWALDKCDRSNVPIGSLRGPKWWDTQDGQKPRVSGFHYKVYGEAIRNHNPGNVIVGPELLCERLCLNEQVTVVVGSPPKNLGALFRTVPNHGLHRWVQQGGFAGDNLVLEADRLDKFKGKITCPSWNVGGAHKQTLELLANSSIENKIFVSKNVCHGVIWDPTLQQRLKNKLAEAVGDLVSADFRSGLRWFIYGLDSYLRDKGRGKAMHDLVAAAVVLDESVCVFSDEVEIYRTKGEWGARLKDGTNTRISIGFDMNRFVEVLAR